MAYVKQCSGCGDGQDCCSDEAKWATFPDGIWTFEPTIQYLRIASTCTFFPSGNLGPNGEIQGTDKNTWGTVTDLNYDYENCWYSDSAGTIIFKKSTDQEDIDSGGVQLKNNDPWDGYNFSLRLNADLANGDMGDLQQTKSASQWDQSRMRFNVLLKTGVLPSDNNDHTTASNWDNFAHIRAGTVAVGDDAGMQFSCP